MSVQPESPPPASQSHFAKFASFTPNDDAPFEHEFARLASSQDWIPGSQEYTRERTIAIKAELMTHYFGDSQHVELTEEGKLEGYQDLCREVGIPAGDSIVECRRDLKNTLVNIVDLIDARRTRSKVQIWDDFDAFRRYTLRPEHRIDAREARKDGGYLASLLQHLRGRRRRGGQGGRKDGSGARVLCGRVIK